jgi:hypothetical protein
MTRDNTTPASALPTGESKPKSGRSPLVGLRLPLDLLGRVDALAAALSCPGMAVTRTEALRVALVTGLGALEQALVTPASGLDGPASAVAAMATKRGLLSSANRSEKGPR